MKEFTNILGKGIRVLSGVSNRSAYPSPGFKFQDRNLDREIDGVDRESWEPLASGRGYTSAAGQQCVSGIVPEPPGRATQVRSRWHFWSFCSLNMTHTTNICICTLCLWLHACIKSYTSLLSTSRLCTFDLTRIKKEKKKEMNIWWKKVNRVNRG